MKYTVEQVFSNLNHTCLGWTYCTFENKFRYLIYEMRKRFGRLFTDEEYHNLKFVMNPPLYHEFCMLCKKIGHDSDMYKDIPIIQDRSLYIGSTDSSPDGIVRLVYEERVPYDVIFHHPSKYATSEYMTTYEFKNGHFINITSAKPHIDHVKFNGPATIVFWKDGTKTVVKHDGKGRKDKRLAVLYAFIRKIYGEGKPYNNILNEIEEAVK